jgi:hypothetical protein
MQHMLLVCCQGSGISRTSRMAYLVEQLPLFRSKWILAAWIMLVLQFWCDLSVCSSSSAELRTL